MFERVRSLAYSMLGRPASLPGLWERVGDDFAGCLILVEAAGEGLQGRITYVPALMRQYGWKVGDVKWRKISPGTIPAFRMEDLFKELDPDTNKLKRTSYEHAQLYFLREDEFVVMTSGSTGRNTRWQRSGNIQVNHE